MNEKIDFIFTATDGLEKSVDGLLSFDDNLVEEEMDFSDNPFAEGDLLLDSGVVSIDDTDEEEIDDASLSNAIYAIVEDNPNLVLAVKSDEEMLIGIQQALAEIASIDVDLITLMKDYREQYPDTFNFLVGLWSGILRTPKVYLANPSFKRLFPEGIVVIYIPYNVFAVNGIPSSWYGVPILRKGTIFVFKNKPIITNLKKTTINSVLSEFYGLNYNRNIIDLIVDDMVILEEESECGSLNLEVFTPLEIVEMILEGDLDIDTVAKCVGEDKYRKVKRILELNSDISGSEW